MGPATVLLVAVSLVSNISTKLPVFFQGLEHCPVRPNGTGQYVARALGVAWVSMHSSDSAGGDGGVQFRLDTTPARECACVGPDRWPDMRGETCVLPCRVSSQAFLPRNSSIRSLKYFSTV